MWRKLIKGLISLTVLLALIFSWAWFFNRTSQNSFEQYGLPSDISTLPQNWTNDVRQQVSHTSFGSQIMPLAWFLHLEHPDQEHLVRDDEHLAALGFIPQNHSPNNPHALPLGFSADLKDGETWVGLTCPACHTGFVKYQNKKIIIDGGSALIHFSTFEQTLLRALEYTLNNAQAFDRFSSKIREESASTLKARLERFTQAFKLRLELNKTQTPYGPGRLDAFGIIFNAVAAGALNNPSNAHPPDAPVSIPVLWDASHFDVVQWNGSAPNKEPGPLGQNVPTAIAVYGKIEMNEGDLAYKSSVNIKNLGYLQSRYYLLHAPQWPNHILPDINHDLTKTGKALYDEHCIGCHALVDASDGRRQIKTTLVSTDAVGTDPVMAMNFIERRVDSSWLQGKPLAVIAGPKLADSVSPLDLVLNAAVGAMLRKPLDTIGAIGTEFEHQLSPQSAKGPVYKARPLNGIWAAAPYLHNGSVPNLWEMLQTPENRSTTFAIGSHEFDPIKVGYESDLIDTGRDNSHGKIFDTTLYGNSNSGHLFGSQLTDEQKWSLIEFLKTL